jgi:uncharacterized integral membrane protein
VHPDRQVPEFHRKVHPALSLNTDAAGYSKTSLRIYSAARPNILQFTCVLIFDAVRPDRQVPEFHRKVHPELALYTDAAGYSKTSLRIYSAARRNILQITDFRTTLKAQPIKLTFNWQ